MVGFQLLDITKKRNVVETRAYFENFFDQLSQLHTNSEDLKTWFKATLVDLEHQYRITPNHQTLF